MAKLQNLLKNFMDEYEAQEDFYEDTPGEWNFYLDQNHAMSLLQDGPEIQLRCNIAETPKRLSTLETLLNANYLSIATEGNTLALDSSGNSVLLTKRLPATTDYPLFEEALENFLNNALHWIEFLED